MPRDRRDIRMTSISEIDLYEGGYTPWERAGQAALSRTPEAFEYAGLEEKYPTRQVMPMVPSYIQNQIDEENIIRKSNEVALKTRQAQLDTYDSKLNEEAAIADQVKLARQRFAGLNPQDPDYQNKRDQIFIDLPYSEFSDDFRNGTVARLDRVNERYTNKTLKPEKEFDLDEAQKILKSQFEINEMSKEQGGLSAPQKAMLKAYEKRLKEGFQKLGITPEEAGIVQPKLAPSTGIQSFGTMEEAEAAERNGLLQSGDKVSIGGRTYIFE